MKNEEIVFEKDNFSPYEKGVKYLETLKKLNQKGWDSYNADPIDPNAVELAKIIAGYITSYLGEEKYKISIFPIHFDGGVLFEIEYNWGDKDIDYDYHLAPTEEISKNLNIEIFNDRIKLYLRNNISGESKLKSITTLNSLIEIKYFLDEVFK